MIVKPLSQDDPHGLMDDDHDAGPGMDVAVGDDDGDESQPGEPQVTQEDDGGVTVDFSPKDNKETDLKAVSHGANLAEAMSEDELKDISNQVVELWEADKRGREEWEESLKDGLVALGIKHEERTKPWPGAAGVHHPLMMEALIRFQSQTIMEIFPAAGPAKSRIAGKETPDLRAQAFRVQDEINYQCTVKMPDYRTEKERQLFSMGLKGSAFTKVYYDSHRMAPCAKLIEAEDFYIPYGESSLECAERFTHLIKISKNQMKKLQCAGMYRDVELTDPELYVDHVDEKEAEVLGIQPEHGASEKYVILECHIDLDLGECDYAVPYVVCIEKESRQVLSLRRNWKEGDQGYTRRSYYVSYDYITGEGAYGLGLAHIIGGVAKASTSVLRQLIDSGTLANLPGGLKGAGLRIKGDDTPIRPGEWREVDMPTGKIQEMIMPLPYKEPSMVLFQLLGQLVEEGRKLASIADTDVGDMKGEAPVGTTLALIERAQKVMSAVQARVHASMGKELKLIADIIKEDMPEQYDYPQDNPQITRRQDFSSAGVEIIPVSDPGATTMSQRVVQHQAALQMASQAPQVYDIRKLHRTGLDILGFKNSQEIVPLPPEQQPQDPVTENMAIIKGSPVQAFLDQDHDAHIAVHMAVVQDPVLQQMIGQSPAAQKVQQAMQSHLAEHLAFQYRNKINQQMGGKLPPPGQPLPPQVESEIARNAVPAAQALLKQNQQQKAQQDAQQMAQDPMVMLQNKELAIKEEDVARKEREADAKLASEERRAAIKAVMEALRISMQAEQQKAKIVADSVQSDAERENSLTLKAHDVAMKAIESILKTKPSEEESE